MFLQLKTTYYDTREKLWILGYLVDEKNDPRESDGFVSNCEGQCTRFYLKASALGGGFMGYLQT